MGDDAEYYMEQQAEAAQFSRACEQAVLAQKQKSLFCWVNGCEQDLLWNWEPMSRVLGVFSNLHNFFELIKTKVSGTYHDFCS